MDQGQLPEQAMRQRLSYALDRAERIYLRVLRAVILVLATLLLVYSAWIGANSLYKITRSSSAVQEKLASVSADEITSAAANLTPKREGPTRPSVDPQQRAFYTSFTERYFRLFKAKFETFKQAEDKQLARDEFDDAFLNTTTRLASISQGELNFETDKADLTSLFEVMTQAAEKPLTKQRLQQYKSARKVPVSHQVQRSKTSIRSGWNPDSTDCPSWYADPVGCPESRVVETPYTETVTTKEFPKGTQSHSQIFRAFQDRYLSLLQGRREANATEAANERANIEAGNAAGKSQLWTVLQVLAGFLVLMFFFLLIAIERHQRRISATPGKYAAMSSPEGLPS